MDTYVVAEDVAAATPILHSLRRQGIECPLTRVVRLDNTLSNVESLAECAGIVFVAIPKLDDQHCAAIRKLRTAIHRDAKVVVVASTADNGMVLQAVRAGARDVLRADSTLDDEIESFVGRMKTELGEKEERGRILTIVPCHSPSDANVLAVNMASAIAARNRCCGLIDFHFRGGDLALLLKINPQHTIMDLFNEEVTIDEAMFRQALAAHEGGIELLAGPQMFGEMHKVRTQACQQIVSLAQKCWPNVVINCEDIHHAEQIRVLANSDEIILVARLDIASLHRTQNHIQFLLHNHVSREQVYVVAMGTGIEGELPPQEVQKFLKISNLHCIPDDPVALLMSVNVGNPLVLESPKSKAAVAMRNCMESILGYREAPDTVATRSNTAIKAAAMLAWNSIPFCRGFVH